MWSTLALLLLAVLLSSSNESGAHAALERLHQLPSRTLQQEAEQVQPAQAGWSPDVATCFPAADNVNFTTAGCGTGCNSCRKQVNPNGDRECACCSKGFVFSTTSKVDCTPCPIGTFMRAEGGSVCRNCSTGLTTGGVGGVTCSWCAAGFRALNNSNPAAGCTECAEGSFAGVARPVGQATTCSPCGYGRWTWRQERIVCNACLPGFRWINATLTDPRIIGVCRLCPMGSWGPGGQAGNTTTTTCRQCPPGYTTAAGAISTSPDACRERYCFPGTGGLNCDTCQPGQWGPGGLATQSTSLCRNCPSGKWSIAGASSEAACNITVAVCSTIHSNSVWPNLPAGVFVNTTEWQRVCRRTSAGARCTANACRGGEGRLNATCGLDGKWTNATNSCISTTCWSAPLPAFISNSAEILLGLWRFECGLTNPGSTCTSTISCTSANTPSTGTLTATCRIRRASATNATLVPTWINPTGSCDIPTCSGAPNASSVSGPGFNRLNVTNWIAKCGKTPRNNTCQAEALELCPAGLCSLDAKCEANGTWTAIGVSGTTGATCGLTTPMPPATAAGWQLNGAPLDPATWATACASIYQRQTCTVAACGTGFLGRLSAVCQADGSWGQLNGTCRSNTCAGAPSGVPVSGGANWMPSSWAIVCGSTLRGSSCTTTDACSPDGSVTAACSAAGTWVNVTGGCSVAPPPVPCANTNGLNQVPWLDSAKWIAQCGNTAVGQTCSKTNSVCVTGKFGTVSAVCQSTGWQIIDGRSQCGDTCAIAPSRIRLANGTASFMPDAWNSICGSTTIGSTCTTTDACTPDGFVSARCNATGQWDNISGGCYVAPPPPPCARSTGMTQVPWLDIDKWIAACGNTPIQTRCGRTDSICVGGPLFSRGTVSALCTANGWTDVVGECQTV